jgi:hypothetical protein
MNVNFWGDVIAKAAVSGGFSIMGDIADESDYNSNVVFSDPSQKPSWAAVQAQMGPVEWKTVRFKRDKKLQACDWTVLPDIPMDPVRKTEWETYRQELRDITDQPDPFNINWPTPPE